MNEPKHANPDFPMVRPVNAAPAFHVSTARPPGLSSAPDAVALLKALRRRWVLASVAGVAMAVLVGGVAWALVPRAKYTAKATLLVPTNPKRIIFEPKDNRADYRTFQRTQVALVKNPKILSDALRKPEIAKLPTVSEQIDAEQWLDQQLKVDFVGGSEVLEITLSGDRPQDLADIVNQVVKSYMSLFVEEDRRERQARLEKLKKLWLKYQENLAVKRKSLKDLVADVGSSDKKALAMVQMYRAEHLATAQKEQMRARSEVLKAEAELSVARARRRAAAEAAPPESLIEEQVSRDQAVARMTEQINVLARKYQDARRATRSDSDPSVTAVLNHWRPAAKDLEALRARARKGFLDAYRQKAESEADEIVAKAEEQVGIWTAFQEALEKDMAKLQTDTKEIASQSLDLETEESEIAIADDTARKVGAEVEAVTVELDAPERVVKLGDAKVPKKKDELRQVKVGSAAALAAFTSVIFGVSFWEFRARRITSSRELVDGLGIKLVGSLPALPVPSRRGSGKVSDRRWQRLLIESVDATRAALLHTSRLESLRVIMVTSAVGGEGKTTLSCHLATSLARAGRRTVLVDCDLRKPSGHRLFDMPAGPGVCELLRGESRLEEVVRESPADGLAFVAAGRCDALALQALSRGDLRFILDDLRGRYDFVIVDSAPILLVADSLQIGQNVDAVLFSVLRDVSRVPLVYSAYDRLSGLGIRMLGAVVTGIESEVHGHEYMPASPSDV